MVQKVQRTSASWHRILTFVFTISFLIFEKRVVAGERKQILVINGETAMLPVVDRMNREVFEAIKIDQGKDTEIFVEWLDLNRFGSLNLSEGMANLLERKYKSLGIDGIVAITESALVFSATYRDRIAPNAPLVHLSVRRSEAEKWNRTPEIYGAVTDYDPAPLLSFIRKAHPSVTRAILITGSSTTDIGWRDFMRISLAGNSEGLEYEFWDGLPMPEIIYRLKSLDPQSVVLTPGILKDAADEWMIGSESLIRFITASPRPVYCFFPERGAQVGTVGGVGPDFTTMGPQAVRILSQAMDRKAPAESGSVVPVRGYFNWGELKRWNIDEKSLPPGSVVLQRVPSFLDLYWQWMIGGCVIFIVQSSFITALLLQRRRRLHAERELAGHREHLTHLTRVSVLGEISGTLSHELSQPLSTMLASAQAARRALDSPDGLGIIKELLDNIVSANKRATSLLERVRSMIRREAGKRVETDMNRLIGEILSLMLGEFSARHISLTRELAKEELAINGDPVQLQQVMVNLLLNSCEAMAAVPESGRQLFVRSSRAISGEVQVEVADCGFGLPNGQIDRIFSPFFTTKSTGLGIGLSICRQIVQEHGGSISASNREGGGLSVVLNLPPKPSPP